MSKNRAYNVYKTIMLIIVTAFVTFLFTSVGFYSYIKNDKRILLPLTEKAASLSSEIYKYRKIIDQYYLGEVNEDDLIEGAVRGYIEGLNDPYTEYISKEEMEEYMQETMGNYIGIGIYITKDENAKYIKVITPIKNSPAERAGILPGDLIISVNDKTYTADELTQISNDIKGEEGVEVTLTILRGTETKEFKIKREKIKVNPVEGKVFENNVGYIQFNSFDETTAEDFKTKYEELKAQNITSLIIDLRNNGGGLVDQAIKIADYMTEKDTVLLYEVDKNGNKEEKKSENDPIIDLPIVVLTNENTASASEILAGALKDLKVAKIIGVKTYGKGVIQEILSVKDSGSIKITTEEYQTPNQNKINKVGIEPDITVELPEDVKSVLNIPEDKDTQLQKAREEIVKFENN